MENKFGFVNGVELKKGDKIRYEIHRLCGVTFTPAIIHSGTIITPVYSTHHGVWVAQISPTRTNPKLPDYDFGTGIMAIYGEDITEIIQSA